MPRWQIITYLVVGLTIFGLLMVGNASVVSASRDFGDKWYYLRLQGIWASLGLIIFFIASKYPHQKLAKYASSLYVVTLVLLVAVLIPGIGSKFLGARRWINLGFTTFQPAELAKLTMSIYLANLFQKRPGILQFALSIGLVAALVMLEPDLGTTIVIVGTAIFTYFGSGGKLLHLVSLAPIGALALIALILFSPYRAARLKTFLDYSHDPLGASYHIRQALIGLGSGGLFGVGLGQSRQKYEFLPEVTTDSIFAVIGEEAGFFGAIILIVLFLFLNWQGLQVAKTTTNTFSTNLCLAISCWLGLQAFINISSVTALFPFTGIPLTFISYGGSSLLVTLAASGILVNIAKNAKK